MTPFQRFANGLHQIKSDTNEMLDEMLAFAEVMARKQNALEMDDNGCYYITVSGPLDHCIAASKAFLERLERMKKQRDEKT